MKLTKKRLTFRAARAVVRKIEMGLSMNSNDIIRELWRCIETGDAPSTPTVAAVRKLLSDSGPGRFDEFWATYPRKQGKSDARKAWRQASKAADFDPDRIMQDVRNRTKADQQWLGGKQFIPLPATYIRGERWHDEIIHAEPQRKKLPNNPAELLQLAERLGIITLGLSEFDLRRAIQEELG